MTFIDFSSNIFSLSLSLTFSHFYRWKSFLEFHLDFRHFARLSMNAPDLLMICSGRRNSENILDENVKIDFWDLCWAVEYFFSLHLSKWNLKPKFSLLIGFSRWNFRRFSHPPDRVSAIALEMWKKFGFFTRLTRILF